MGRDICAAGNMYILQWGDRVCIRIFGFPVLDFTSTVPIFCAGTHKVDMVWLPSVMDLVWSRKILVHDDDMWRRRRRRRRKGSF